MQTKAGTIAFAAALGLAAAAGGQAALAADADAGAKVYREKCKACHYIDREKHKAGPHLVGIFGRRAGAIDGYGFTKAMRDSGVVWDDSSVEAYLAAPDEFIRGGNKSAFLGLKDPEDRADVIAYMRQFR